VIERYVHYDGAGDQYVGRVVVGLPLGSGDFAVLPPHFQAGSEIVVAAAGKLNFPRLWAHQSLHGVLTKFLASLAFHMDFLVNTLPAKHPLLASVLFGDMQLATDLQSIVKLTSDTMQPTGIPPRVALHVQLNRNMEAIRSLPQEVSEGIEKLLEDKGVTDGNITQSLLEELLKKAVNDVVMTTQTHSQATTPVESNALPVHPVHFWRGRWHLLPEDFELPSVDVATGWHLWWCGSQGRGIPALLKVQPRDLTRKQAKILCEWRFAVDELQSCHRAATGSDI
ncbi:hypothetical protein DYB32_009043, partial [Aphanomyces invadans]